MAINVTSQILHEGPRNLIMQWTGISDGSGSEDGVVKVDVSELTPACDAVKIMRISGSVEFGVVELYWDALTPEKFAVLSGAIDLDYCKSGGLVNSMAGGATGDLLLSTVGFELNSTYSLHVEMVKK
jgi:hypothetical protein